MVKAVNSVKKVLKSWLEDNSIVSMMDKNNKKIRIRDEWADNARLIGRENKGRKKVELFIRVKTDLPFNRLKERVWELCQKEELWVFQKFTEMEHVKRIGILAWVCGEHASLASYQQRMTFLGRLADRKIELKKELVFQNNNSKKCVVVYAVENDNDEIDSTLLKSFRENNLGIRHVSFRKIDSNGILAAMRLNYYPEKTLKFVVLKEVCVDDKASYDGKIGTLKQVTKQVKVNSKKIIVGVEIGTGKHENNALVVTKRSELGLCEDWISQRYGKDFRCDEDRPHKSSIAMNTDEDNKHLEEIREFMSLERMEQNVEPSNDIATSAWNQNTIGK